MKRKIYSILLTGGLLLSTVVMLSLTSCNKTGPAGAAGRDGANGANGADGISPTEACKACHSPALVDKVAVEFGMSKHNWGTAAFEESGNNSCAPCHTQEGFRYVCDPANNVSTVWTNTGGVWTNPYAAVNDHDMGELGCGTCHSSLHTTYGISDLTVFTNTAPVPMTMWGGAKTIDLQQDGGKSNLCVKCHQPRPLQCNVSPTSGGRMLNYDSIRQFPTLIFYDSTTGVVNKYVKPSYRMHTHYGAVGAIYAGKGGIEFTGTLAYGNSTHTTVASCQDCHMAPMTGRAGGHSFQVRNAVEAALGSGTTWNFNGCNTAACHGDDPLSATHAKFVNKRAAIKTLLDNLATKINACGGGHDIMTRQTDPTLNLWAGITTNSYDGYLDIYSSSSNATGYWRDPYGSGSTNAAKPKFPKLTFGQMGAIMNFQLCLREYSLGVHNFSYSEALLTNSIAVLTAQGF